MCANMSEIKVMKLPKELNSRARAIDRITRVRENSISSELCVSFQTIFSQTYTPINICTHTNIYMNIDAIYIYIYIYIPSKRFAY